MTRVLYLHGLGGSPQSSKAQALRACGQFDVHAPAIPTFAAEQDRQRGRKIRPDSIEPCAGLVAAEIDRFKPDVVVGSSFGAALLLDHMHAVGTVRRVVLLAGAGVKVLGHVALPDFRLRPSGQSARAILVHGRLDDVVPIEHSRLLAASQPYGVLVELHDDHQLTASTALLPSFIMMALA